MAIITAAGLNFVYLLADANKAAVRDLCCVTLEKISCVYINLYKSDINEN